MTTDKRLLAEFMGTAGLLIVVVGSGIMGESLSGGNAALALLANSLATGTGLYALIQTFGPVSGGHFNPAVSLVEWRWKNLSARDLFGYVVAQISGAICGVFIAHLMFGQEILQLSSHRRGEFRFVLSEGIATLGLILVIALSGKKNVHATPVAIACYITSAYWCTSSTAFANPAVTLARTLTNTFSGVHFSSVPSFIAVQFLGAEVAFRLARRLHFPLQSRS